MSYVTKHLMAGEEVVGKTQLQWIIYLPAIALLALAILVLAVIHASGNASGAGLIIPVLFAAAAAVSALAALVRQKSSEFVVTSKRVLVKTGMLRRHSTEILLRQVEGITVDQGVLGRMFDFGTIVVEGTGSDRTPYPEIAGPLSFRLAVQEQIERNANHVIPSVAELQTPKEDRYSTLLRLNELREKGIVTDEEFKKEKARILGP